eukprot:TRINITY_DN7085_c0_g4_i1.p1 TRINITY_DN7085_c0_g4~~TRINITY_DN7085_c0_g4_i1.p1  ORF type:complete len:198 (-),score=30.39 TRINITY_DN7085_c0_g4_i1:99-692(-)
MSDLCLIQALALDSRKAHSPPKFRCAVAREQKRLKQAELRARNSDFLKEHIEVLESRKKANPCTEQAAEERHASLKLSSQGRSREECLDKADKAKDGGTVKGSQECLLLRRLTDISKQMTQAEFADCKSHGNESPDLNRSHAGINELSALHSKSGSQHSSVVLDAQHVPSKGYSTRPYSNADFLKEQRETMCRIMAE